MIRFHSISIKNFLSIEDASYEFEHGLTMVQGVNYDNPVELLEEENSLGGQSLRQSVGSNGAGKSSLFDALEWALYGTSTRVRQADSVVNRKRKSDCSVKVVFSSSGITYTVIRYRRHSEYGNGLFLLRAEEDLSNHSIRETQAKINQVLKIPQDVFTATVVLNQGMRNRFTLLTDSQRKELIESVRDSTIWERARGVALQNIKSIQSKLNTSLVQLGAVEGKLQELTIQVNQLQVDLKNSVSNQELLGNLASEVQTITLECQREESHHKTLSQDLESCGEELVRLRASLQEKLLRNEPLQENLHFLESCLKGTTDVVCPTCKTVLQAGSPEQRDHLLEEITSLKAKISQNSTSELDALIQKTLNRQTTLNQGVVRSSQLLNQLHTRLRSTEQQYNSIQSNQEAVRVQIVSQLKSLDERIQTLKHERKGLQKTLRDSGEEKIVYEELEYLFSYRGIRAHLVAQDIAYLNERVQQYSQHLFQDYVVRIETGGSGDIFEKIAIVVTSPQGYELDYLECSGGERRRIDICVQLGLRDLMVAVSKTSTNLLVLDEVFEGLDIRGVGGVLQVLRELAKEAEVYVITHLVDVPPTAFDRLLVVTKSQGTSVLSLGLSNQ